MPQWQGWSVTGDRRIYGRELVHELEENPDSIQPYSHFLKCDVAGNDKNFGFNVWNDDSTELAVFEGAIDLMSYVDIYSDLESNKLALGMLSDAPLVTFLQEYPQIQSIKFCLDNDKPGREAAERLMQKYYGLGYEVTDCPPPQGFKDYNEWLVELKVPKT